MITSCCSSPRVSQRIPHRSSRCLERPPARTRDGRLLVECIIATLLIAVTGLMVGAATRAVSESVQTAQLTVAAWAVATTSAESSLGLACGALPPAGNDPHTRVRTQWTEQLFGGRRERDLSATLQHSPLAALSRPATPLTWQQGLPCP